MIEAILLLLAFSFGIHVSLANLGIGLSTVVPLLKRKGERKNDNRIINVSRELMKFYASIYAIIGVFGTAFTVFLLSFYPDFIGLAGHIAFYPFAIAILAIALHFLAITTYWYGWDRWDSKTHYYIGLLLLISVYLIPFGFRSIFAFLNIPIGLEFEPKLYLNVFVALTNPTFIPLYLKTIFAALSATFFVIASGYMYRYVKRRDEYALEISKMFMPYATVMLLLTLIFGIIYALSLYYYVPYKFNNAFGRNLWMFAVKMIMVLLQFYAVYVFYRYIKHGVVKNANIIIIAGPAALIGIFSGEMLNSFSQYPYFVAKLGDPDFISAIPEPYRSSILDALTMLKFNPLTSMPSLYIITAMFLVPLLIATVFFLYLSLIAKEKTDLPE